MGWQTNIDRRDFLKQLGALGMAGWTRPRSALQTATASLKQLAAEKGLLFGSCLALKYCVQSAAYQQLFLDAMRHRHTGTAYEVELAQQPTRSVRLREC